MTAFIFHVLLSQAVKMKQVKACANRETSVELRDILIL